MCTLKYNIWSPWYTFGQLFEYRGLIDETGKTKRKIKATWKGSTARLHRDNGFRLRSFDYRSGSFSNLPLKLSLEEVPCPLIKGDLGVYWLRIKTEQGQYNYIGLSRAEKPSMFKGLIHQFTNIAGTAEHSSGYRDTEEFKVFREDMKKLDLDNDSSYFFGKYVEIAFIKVEDSKSVRDKIVKIRGEAMQEFKDKFGHFPELNSRD